MSQNEIHSKLKLEAAIRKQNEQIKNLENQKAAEKIKVDPSSSNNQIEDSIKMLSLVDRHLPELSIVTSTLHNGVRHEFYCSCITCRKCLFCPSKLLKNKSGCLTHYGLLHPSFKELWKP